MRNYYRMMMEQSNIVTINGETVPLCEYVKDRLYFVTLSLKKEPKQTADTHYFSIDDELVYVNYYSDFGPLNLGCLYRYCVKLNTKLKCFALGKKKIVHYTTINPQKRANAAYLIASFAVIYLNMTPKQALKPLLTDQNHTFRPFQDATMGTSEYHLYIIDCLAGIYRALQHGFFNFNDFDLDEYEQYEKIEFGDLNWIIPDKFIAFCGPSIEYNTSYKPPKHYIHYFHINEVSTIIRLNKKTYNAQSFTKAGFDHHDLYFVDGSCPCISLVNRFLEICEAAKGAIAVHCKAGLGRTGSLIGAYMMKHYRMTAKESIAWLRICRPGSVIGHQQAWLEGMEQFLWKTGDTYRIRRHGDGDYLPHHKHGVYSIVARKQKELFQNENKYPKEPRPSQFNSSCVDKLNTGNCLKYLLGRSVREGRDNVPHNKSNRKKSRHKSTERNNNMHHEHLGRPCYCSPPVPIPRKNHTLQSTRHTHPEHRLDNSTGDYKNMNNREATQGDHLNAIKLMRARATANDKSKYYFA